MLALAVIAFFECIELIHDSSCSYLFDQFPFSMLLLLFHGNTLSDPLCQGHCIYFTAHIAVIYYYNKWSVVDSRKFGIYCFFLFFFFEESHCSPALIKRLYFKELVLVNFCSKYSVLSERNICWHFFVFLD